MVLGVGFRVLVLDFWVVGHGYLVLGYRYSGVGS